MANGAAALLGCAEEVQEEDPHILFCSGKDAGDTTPKSWYAIACAAQTEGSLH